MADPGRESPDLVGLFRVYTSADDSIGSHLAAASQRAAASDPLLAATSTDLALYPGDGQQPTVLPFRRSTRGFSELAAVSHLGPALASLIALRDTEPDGTWRSDAERLLRQCQRSRKANSTALWRDTIAVDAYRGREPAIARMVDYALVLTIRYLSRVLGDGRFLTYDTLRAEYLDDGGHDIPVSFNRIMVATFFLVGMDISYRLIQWLDSHGLQWPRLMVVVAGQQGRPTAGVTWRTNSVAQMIQAASRGELPLDRLLIAPHAATFASPQDGDLTEVVSLEPSLRQLWAQVRATVGLGGHMFPSYPAFSPDAGETAPAADSATTVVGEMPPITDPGNWLAMITRLRVVLEDPRQLLSGAVSDFAARQLAEHHNEPAAIDVPGLDGEPYPDEPPP